MSESDESEYPMLKPDAILKLRNPSELPHHWTLRKEFLTVHNGKYSLDRLVCLSHVFVNVECMGLTYPDKVMLTVKSLGANVDKGVIQSAANTHPTQPHREQHQSQQHYRQQQQQYRPQQQQYRPQHQAQSNQPTSSYFKSYQGQRQGRPFYNRGSDNQRRF